MIFPIGDDQVKKGHFPFFSYAFIVLNVVAFIYKIRLSPEQQQGFDMFFGAIPAEIVQRKDLFTLFTSMFVHGGWGHLIGNMLFLFVFADNIEATIGNLKFLVFYLLGGMAAIAAHIFFNFNSPYPMVGASGAISAVMGAYLIMFPHSRVKILFFIITFRVSAWLFLGLWIIQQWMLATTELENNISSGVALWAHIGGFAMGIISGFLFRTKGYLDTIELEVD